MGKGGGTEKLNMEENPGPDRIHIISLMCHIYTEPEFVNVSEAQE
jgi:hypothetical protein